MEEMLVFYRKGRLVMNKKKKILIVLGVLSVIIVILGILAGAGVFMAVSGGADQMDPIHVDGSDFTGLFKFIGVVGGAIMGLFIIFCTLAFVTLGWGIYIFVRFIITGYRKASDKKKFLIKVLVISIAVVAAIILEIFANGLVGGLLSTKKSW